MCRLFGVITKDPIGAASFIWTAPQSLYVQSHIDKKRKQGDGWGIGWFESGQPRVFKSPQAMYRDKARVLHAIRKPKGTILLGHVRWASNPLKLPRHELIGPAHTQPFRHDSWLFVHNGTLLIPREVKAALGSWEKFVKGKNDSEVLFYWLLKTVIHRSAGQSWPQKLRASLHELDRIWKSCKNRYPIYKGPYHGFNWVLTNGRLFLAFCYVNSRGFDKAKALSRRQQPYYQLQLQQTERAIAVASEPMTGENNWRPFRHGQLAIVQRTFGRPLSVKLAQVM